MAGNAPKPVEDQIRHIFNALYDDALTDDNIRRAIQGDNTAAIKQLLRARAFPRDPTDVDMQDLKDLFSMFKTDDQRAQEQAAAKAQAEADSAKVKKDYGQAVKDIASLDPRTKLLYYTLDAAGDVAHAAGNASRNENYLVKSILENSRSQSDKQENIYGKNIQDKATGLMAGDSVRRNENAGAFWDTMGNILHKVIGKEQQDNMMQRQMKMIPYDRELNMPGDYYQKMSQDAKRAANLGKGD